MSWNNENNVVKKDGQCYNRGMQKYCSFWKARHNITVELRKGSVYGYRCSLFNIDKEGYDSVPECNAKYGQTYDGKPIP